MAALNKQYRVEVLATLEAIERVNQSIARHKAKSEPDRFALEQWQRVKADLIRQLQELLAVLDVPLQAVAA